MSEPQPSIVLADLSKDALRDLLNNLTQAKAFVLDQAPEFCRQLITRDMVLSLVLGVVLLLAVAPLLWLMTRQIRAAIAAPDCSGTEIAGVFISVFSGIAAALCAGYGFYGLYIALSIYLAPKVYLVEQLMRMVK